MASRHPPPPQGGVPCARILRKNIYIFGTLHSFLDWKQFEISVRLRRPLTKIIVFAWENSTKISRNPSARLSCDREANQIMIFSGGRKPVMVQLMDPISWINQNHSLGGRLGSELDWWRTVKDESTSKEIPGPDWRNARFMDVNSWKNLQLSQDAI